MDSKTSSLKRKLLKPRKKVVKADSKENLSLSELKLRYQFLKKQSITLDKEIAELEDKGITGDLRPEMQALHEYNDIKDVTQVVLGYLSDTENCTVAELHKKYNLPSESN